MALLRMVHCHRCGQEVRVWVGAGQSMPSMCPACMDAEAQRKKVQALADSQSLPLEERIARIEEWIYDHRQVQHGYIAPPRF